MGKVTETEAKAIVVKYLTNQNRPYSVNDLVANLHNEVPKTVMQKTLDALVEEGKIKEKVTSVSVLRTFIPTPTKKGHNVDILP